MNKVKITNSCQFERLVKEMEKNPSLSRGFGKGRLPNNFHEQWESIATILNSLGPPIRTGDGWRKVWSGLKSKVRRKIATNKAECKEAKLGPLDQAVANLLQFDRVLNQESMVQGSPNIEDRAGCSPLSSLQLNKSSTTISKMVVPSSASSISATSTSLSSAVSASSISATSTSTSLSSAVSASSISATSTSLSSAVSASSISATSTSSSSVVSASSISATSTSSSSAVSASSTNQINRVNIRENIAELRRRRSIAKASLVAALGNVLAGIERLQQAETPIWRRNRNRSE